MELRYLGFDQQKKLRAYRFDWVAKGEATRHFTITADLSLFLAHRVGIQEGPGLCATKLNTDLRESAGGTHELTESDLRAHAAARTLEASRKAESRRFTPRRAGVSAEAQKASPWRGTRP
jgi:hypothetical protein